MNNPTEHLVKHFFPSGFRVMIVDSDLLYLDIEEDMFLACKFKVSSFANPKTALSVLREHPGEYDLVLAELNMPEMDGLELLQTVNSELKIPVVLMSSDTDMDTKMNAITKGAASFLDKPIDLVLVKTIWKYAAWENIPKEKKAPVKASDSPSMIESRNNDMNQNKRMRMKVSKKQKNGITIEENINVDKGDQENTNYEEDADLDKSEHTKRNCFSWTPFLELLFQNAVQTLGPGASPSKILKFMNVEGVERDHVASHLQKYRIRKKKQALVIQGSCQNNNKIPSEVIQNQIQPQPQPQTLFYQAQSPQHIDVPSTNFTKFNPWPSTNMSQYPPYKKQTIPVDIAIAHNPKLIPTTDSRGMPMRQPGLDNQKMKTHVPGQLHQEKSAQFGDDKQAPSEMNDFDDIQINVLNDSDDGICENSSCINLGNLKIPGLFTVEGQPSVNNDAEIGFDANIVFDDEFGPTNDIGGVANSNILHQNNQMVTHSSTTPQLQNTEECNGSNNEEHVNDFPFHGINAPIPAHWA